MKNVLNRKTRKQIARLVYYRSTPTIGGEQAKLGYLVNMAKCLRVKPAKKAYYFGKDIKPFKLRLDYYLAVQLAMGW